MPLPTLRFRTLQLFLTLAAFFISTYLFAAGIRGTVKSETGEPLAYTTIFVKQTGSGTTTNEKGSFEMVLAPGKYEIIFQYLGFETAIRDVEITDSFVVLDIVLKTQITVLE
ncbi:MAG TPA: carboxypeptidase-like regulatory domain-containing protein, partial [Chryseolinea sp.]